MIKKNIVLANAPFTAALLVSLGVAGCGVKSTQPGTGGVMLGDPDAGDAATPPDAATTDDGASNDGGGDMPDGAATEGGSGFATCPRAFAVIDSDYKSTNVSIVSPAGAVLSESIISSGSAPIGSAPALSGDVVVPFTAPSGNRVVLIDRTTSVLTFVDVASAQVTKQIAVGTGFAANPHDYLEVGPHKAYVTRYGSNAAPGAMMFDSGGDVLIVDTDAGTLTGHIALDGGTFPPSPDKMAMAGGIVWVPLQRFAADFSAAGDARIVGINPATDTIAWTIDVAGIANCGAPAVSPSGHRVAVACSGFTGLTGNDGRVGVVVFDATTNPPHETGRYNVSQGLGASMSPPLAFTSEKILVGVANGDFTAGTPDVAYVLDLENSEAGAGDAGLAVTTVVQAGGPFVLGDVLCAPGCNTPCLLADADKKALRRLPIVDGRPTAGDVSAPIDPGLGLPPRTLGAL